MTHRPSPSSGPNLLGIRLSIALGLSLALLGVSAHAELGGKVSTIEQDRLSLHAKIAQARQSGTTVHSLTQDNGLVIKEFAAADGTVFAISWSGPARPDLKRLLGSYFARFQADNKISDAPTAPRAKGQKIETRLRRGLSSTHMDFIVRSGGHGGEFWGYAYLPAQTPSGFSTQALQ